MVVEYFNIFFHLKCNCTTINNKDYSQDSVFSDSKYLKELSALKKSISFICVVLLEWHSWNSAGEGLLCNSVCLSIVLQGLG